MRFMPCHDCCDPECCSGTLPGTITLEITGVPSPCDYWNGTWVLGDEPDCRWLISQFIPGVGNVQIDLYFYSVGGSLKLRVIANGPFPTSTAWCAEIPWSLDCCDIVGTVLELQGDSCGGECTVDAGSEIEITGVTGC